MRWQKQITHLAVVLAWMGLLIPATPSGAGSPVRHRCVDVSLTPAGTLSGQFVDPQGRPLADRCITVRQAEQVVSCTWTDSDGLFRLNLPPGVYRIDAATTSRPLRVWSHGAAPPAARPMARLVAAGDAVRGQGYEEPFPPWLVTLAGSSALVGFGILLSSSHDLEAKLTTPASP